MNPAPPATIKQIICIKWGTFYGPQYVNILYSMVARNITGPFNLYCFTDNATGIRPEVICHPLPKLGCEIPPGTKGKWRKTALWGRDLFGVTGTALFIDLDSIIVGNIDEYFDYGNPEDVITARNWAKPHQRLGQTSVFRFKIGSHPYMLDDFRANPEGITQKYQFEQHYVTHGVRSGIKFWPSAWTRHFRLHCLPMWPLRMFKAPRLPQTAKIITFPGGPNPSDIIEGKWSRGDTHRKPWEHLKYVWRSRHQSGKRLMRELTHYVKPAPWLKEHWRED